MNHKESQVFHLISIKEDIDEDQSQPVYRHSANENLHFDKHLI